MCSGVGAGVPTTSGGIEVVRVTIRYGVCGYKRYEYKIKIVAQCDCATICYITDKYRLIEGKKTTTKFQPQPIRGFDVAAI